MVLEKLVRGPKFLLEKMVPRTIFSGKIGPTLKILVPPEASSQNDPILKILVPPQYGIVIANKLVNNLSIISIQSEHDRDKIYIIGISCTVLHIE